MFLMFGAGAYYVTQIDLGTRIRPKAPVEPREYVDTVNETSDINTLKKLCLYLAQEQDSTDSATKQVRRNLERAYLYMGAIMMGIGILSFSGCLYIYWKLRAASLEAANLSSNITMESDA